MGASRGRWLAHPLTARDYARLVLLAQSRSYAILEELNAQVLDCGYDKRPVKVGVVLFTRRFCDQQTAVTRSTVQKPSLVKIVGLMLAAHGVIRTEFCPSQRVSHMFMNTAAFLYEPSQCSF